MFITDVLNPAEMLSELLNQKSYVKEDTVRFRTLRHDKDLCPGFRENIANMLDAYKSHRTDVQDTQGPRDEGVDVHLYYHQNEYHAIGLQIKSFDEINAWAEKRDPGFIMRLKAQYAAAMQRAGVEEYLLVLCTDEVAHARQIRTICSELRGFGGLRIVLPRQALNFLELSRSEISTFVTLVLCGRDPILADAQRAAAALKPDTAFVLMSLMCLACMGQVTISQEDLIGIWAEWEELAPNTTTSKDRLSEMFWELDGNGFSYGVDGDDTLDISAFPTSWCALYFGQKHRGSIGDLAALLKILPTRRQFPR